MRKILCLIIVLFSTICIFATTKLGNIEKANQIGSVDKIIENNNTNWQDIDFYYLPSYVTKGKYDKQRKYISKVSINQVTYICTNPKLFYNGMIIKKNTMLDSNMFESNMRVVSINDNVVVLDNLDETYVTFSREEKIYADSKLDGLFLYRNVKVDAELANVIYNDGLYILKYKIDNSDGFFLSGMVGSIQIEETILLKDGIIVYKEAISYDNNGKAYAEKLRINITDGKEQYLKVYVTIVEEFDECFLIQGNLNENNVIIVRL